MLASNRYYQRGLILGIIALFTTITAWAAFGPGPNFTKTVAAAGTQERLLPVVSNQFVRDAVIQASPGNAGTIYVGGANVDSTNGIALTPGASVSLSGMYPGDAMYSLADFWLDVATNGDGVRVMPLVSPVP